jgi:hypothetical protein
MIAAPAPAGAARTADGLTVRFPHLKWSFTMSIPAPRQTSSYAVISLVAGILGWTLLPLLGSLAAIIFGHMARGEIRRSNGQLDGDGLAVTGLVLGWLSAALWVLGILAFIVFFGGLAWIAAMNY